MEYYCGYVLWSKSTMNIVICILFHEENGCHSSRTNVSTFSSENKVNLNGNFFFFSYLDNPLFRSRILSEIDALTNASHVVTVYAHAQNHVTCRKENGGQPQATVYLLQDKITTYQGRAVLRIPWVSKSTINKTINAWGVVCYPIHQHSLEVSC